MLTPSHLSDMDCSCFLLHDRVYFRMGQLFAMSIVQMGIGFPCEAIFKYICQGNVTGITVDPNVSDGLLYTITYKVCYLYATVSQ